MSFVSKYGVPVAARYGGWYCHYCLIPVERSNNPSQGKRQATIDHIVAIANGGREDDMLNMVLCCEYCNRRKGTMSYRAFMQRTKNLRRKRRERKSK